MRMTDEQEYAARSQRKWGRDGADWILMHGRRRGPLRSVLDKPPQNTPGLGALLTAAEHWA